MVLLSIMTGATIETRLVLLAWISLFGIDPIPDDRLWIASILRVKDKHLKVAIDYLVEEGFLLKRRSFLRADAGKKKGAKYSYLLRLQSWEVWQKALLRMRFNDVFKHVVDGNVCGKSVALKKSKPLNAPERIVLALLVTHADSALYVVGFDHDSNCRLLGISALNLDKLIRSLVSNGYLTAYSHLNSSKSELRSLGRLYRIDALTPNRKTINIGLPPVEGVESIALLASLMRYFNNAAKRRKPDIYPTQSSPLSDERYFKLSKIFHDNRLFPFMHRLCQSIIFSTASDCLPRLIAVSEAERNNAMRQQRDEVTDAIVIKLTAVVLNGKSESKKLNSTELTEKQPVSENELEMLARYTIMQLSQELTYSVITLVRQLILFQEIYRVPFSIIGHHPNTCMSALTEPSKSPDTEVKHETDSRLPAVCNLVTIDHPKLRLITDFVLMLSVPNSEHLNDCLLRKDELFTEDSRSEDPRVKVAYEVKLHQLNRAKQSKTIASVSDNAGR